eukprot:COSAG01_NODE_19981_length_978_cov_1.483504_1_plen_70_part_10
MTKMRRSSLLVRSLTRMRFTVAMAPSHTAILPSGDSSTVGAQPGSSGGDGGDDDGPVDEIAERQDTRIVG